MRADDLEIHLGAEENFVAARFYAADAFGNRLEFLTPDGPVPAW